MLTVSSPLKAVVVPVEIPEGISDSVLYNYEAFMQNKEIITTAHQIVLDTIKSAVSRGIKDIQLVAVRRGEVISPPRYDTLSTFNTVEIIYSPDSVPCLFGVAQKIKTSTEPVAKYKIVGRKVVFTSNYSAPFSIYSPDGRLVAKGRVLGQKVVNLPYSGVYFVRFKGKTKKEIVR